VSRKHLVVSAVNLTEGGTLTVLRECLRAARRDLAESWEITALVHRADLVDVPGIRYIEFPDIKKHWISRVKFEYFDCRSLSRRLSPDFWLSLHDMSPRVGTVRQAVYCHNAMCFYRMSLREALLDPKLVLFSLFYGVLYGINISSNDAVIVQQDWIRKEFKRRYGISNTVVAHPLLEKNIPVAASKRRGSRFFYPSFPRVFKNFESLLSAWALLCVDPTWQGDLTVTVDGSENAYAQDLIRKFGHLRNVRFAGRLTYSDVQDEYRRSDCLVFPSRLETWGMPLSEAKQHGLPILVSDLPYAHEAVGEYDGVSYFSPTNPQMLADLMRTFSEGRMVFSQGEACPIEQPYAQDWATLLQLILSDGTEPNSFLR
jgi:glycosyltransferase involved in cell wall biosynthesis